MDNLSITAPRNALDYVPALDAPALFVLDEQALKKEILHSLKAAKASRKPLLVIFLSVGKIVAGSHGNNLLNLVLSSLASSSLGEQALLGWYRSNRVLGLIPKETGESTKDEIDACTDKIGACLAGYLDADEIQKVQVVAYVITEKAGAGGRDS